MIDDSVLNARIPRLGTITVGRGTTRGKGVQPHRATTLVFHTNDPELANACQVTYGGDILRDSPTWEYDVVSDVREVHALMLAPGFRQHLELWRAAECLRRCDGVKMSTKDGRPANEPCACEPEIARGQERACRPSTVLPLILDLDVERLGVWELRSTSWGTASAISGTMRALSMVGAADKSVPAVVSMVDRTTRDATGQVRDVIELHATIAKSHASLASLAGQAAALDGPPTHELPAGDEADRLELMQSWADYQGRAHRLGLRDQLVEDWRSMFGGGRDFDDLHVEELRGWVELVKGTVADAEGILERERAEASGSPVSGATPTSGSSTAENVPAQRSGDVGSPSGDEPPKAPPPDEDPWDAARPGASTDR